MLKYLKSKSLHMSAGLFAGLVFAGDAHAANNFGSIGKRIINSIADLPGLLTALSYLFGILLGVLGILKIKDHVENPTQTQLKDGAIRLLAGGALFALPIIFEAMFETLGTGTQQVSAIDAVKFDINS